MNKKLVAVLSLALLLCFVGALIAQAQRQTFGKTKVTLYSGDGKVIHEWEGPLKVEVRDGAFTFSEPGTNHVIRITGTVVVDAAP